MQTSVGILTFMSMRSLMNVLRLILLTKHEFTEKYFTNIQIMQLHKSTVFAMLMDIKMPTIVMLNLRDGI